MQPVSSVHRQDAVQSPGMDLCPLQRIRHVLPLAWPEVESPEGHLLLNAGLTPDGLWEQWGIVLWRVRLKGERVKLKAEACRPVDETALRAWLSGRMGPGIEVSLTLSPVSSCCGSGCKGCLIGNALDSTSSQYLR